MSRPAAMPTDVFLRLQAARSGAAPAATSGVRQAHSARATAGKAAKRAGDDWEDQVEQLLDLLRRRGLLTWMRTPEPMRRLAPLGRGHWDCVAESEGPPDYVLMTRGVGIALEAKQTTCTRWELSCLALHQATALDDWERHEGVGAIALRMARPWILPWSQLSPVWWRWQRREHVHGQASLLEEDLPGLGAVPMDPDGRWLSIARRVP